MDIERCYEVLELDSNACLEEVRQAYRDSVSIWHPDRFGESNPRVIKRAEEKLKEINNAYETLVIFLSEKDQARIWKGDGDGQAAKERAKAWSGTPPPGGKNRSVPGVGFSSRTEAVAEAGTRVLLTASSRLMHMLRRLIDAD